MPERFSRVASPENLFATEEWLETWWRHFGRERPRVGDGALYEARRFPVRVLRLVGAGISDMAPVEPEGLKEILANESWDVFVGEALPTGSGDLLRGRVLRRHSSPVVRFGAGSWEEFLAARSPNFRSQVRRRERKLLEEHGLRYRFSEERGALPADLETLFALHAARWPHGSSSFGWNARCMRFTGSSRPSPSTAAGYGFGSWRRAKSPWRRGTASGSTASSTTTRLGGIRPGSLTPSALCSLRTRSVRRSRTEWTPIACCSAVRTSSAASPPRIQAPRRSRSREGRPPGSRSR